MGGISQRSTTMPGSFSAGRAASMLFRCCVPVHHTSLELLDLVAGQAGWPRQLLVTGIRELRFVRLDFCMLVVLELLDLVAGQAGWPRQLLVTGIRELRFVRLDFCMLVVEAFSEANRARPAQAGCFLAVRLRCDSAQSVLLWGEVLDAEVYATHIRVGAMRCGFLPVQASGTVARQSRREVCS
eukprot:s823_g8.t1